MLPCAFEFMCQYIVCVCVCEIVSDESQSDPVSFHVSLLSNTSSLFPDVIRWFSTSRPVSLVRWWPNCGLTLMVSWKSSHQVHLSQSRRLTNVPMDGSLLQTMSSSVSYCWEWSPSIFTLGGGREKVHWLLALAAAPQHPEEKQVVEDERTNERMTDWL